MKLDDLRDKAFLNFLRGMETHHHGGGVQAFGLFLNFLRGMETEVEPPDIPPPQGLPKLP